MLILMGTALTLLMVRLRRSGHAIFNGSILLVLGLSITCALPVLSRLPWAEFADEVIDEAVAAIQFLEATYAILTL